MDGYNIVSKWAEEAMDERDKPAGKAKALYYPWIVFKGMGRFRPEDHPRGQPENAGEFAAAGGQRSGEAAAGAGSPPARSAKRADDVIAAVAAIKERLRKDQNFGTADVQAEIKKFEGLSLPELSKATAALGMQSKPKDKAHALRMLAAYAVSVQAGFERSDA